MWQPSIAQLFGGAEHLTATFLQGESFQGGEAWYKVAAGVLGIPAAAVGIVLSYNLTRKTALESRKIELEIEEKQSQHRDSPLPVTAIGSVVQPLAENQLALLLLVRFVVLELTLRMWNVVPSAISFLTSTATSSMYMWFRNQPGFFSGPSIWVLPLGAAVLGALLDVVYWIIVFGFGWPLFKDTCRFLNIPIQSLWDLPFLGRWRGSPSAQ